MNINEASIYFHSVNILEQAGAKRGEESAKRNNRRICQKNKFVLKLNAINIIPLFEIGSLLEKVRLCEQVQL